eukprot:TRINITY_DN47812_c0_g1_i1.p1 TRINITY_DN47812_c0_g1~~TRINITY_DN47812_c0_g1_i1.p1  ORF type:complete len:136 (+),score=45.25 TRINITY_DN47812_c0_g1_i1:64-471(+)
MAEIYYVPEELFATLREKVKQGKEVTDDDVGPLTSPMTAEDDAVMIPVDMRGIGKEYEDLDDMVAELGPKASVEAFAKARDYFVANKGNDPEEDRATPISGRELKDMMMDEMGDEEDDDDEEEEVAAPPAKKAKS